MAGEGLRGVDVSQHQGSVQWERVHGEGFKFAIIKSSEGQDFIDPADGNASAPNDVRLDRLRARCREIRQRDMALGVYHYLRPRPGRTGDVEADWAVKVAKSIGWGKEGDVRLVVDVEETELGRFATHRYLGQFVRGIHRRVGHKPIIYTFPFFWNSLGNPKNFGCPLWIAHFEVEADRADPVGPGRHLAAHLEGPRLRDRRRRGPEPRARRPSPISRDRFPSPTRTATTPRTPSTTA